MHLRFIENPQKLQQKFSSLKVLLLYGKCLRDTFYIITVANERPHMKSLNRYLTEYSEFWRSTGLKLGLQSSVLDLIEANHHLQQRECFRATLQRWLQQDVYAHASWCKLELAITNAKREYYGYDTLDASKSNDNL